MRKYGPARRNGRAQGRRERSTTVSGKIDSRTQDITKSALNGYDAGDAIFKQKLDLKLITKMIQLNEGSANVFWKCGHYRHFRSTWHDEGENLLGEGVQISFFDMPDNVYDELYDIINTDYDCPKSLRGPMTALVHEIYNSSRCPELGTVSAFSTSYWSRDKEPRLIIV
jgi:hypothetical protein